MIYDEWFHVRLGVWQTLNGLENTLTKKISKPDAFQELLFWQMLDHRKNFYLRQNVPKRCLSVRLCNIHQSWILMSSLTEKGTESILLRNKNTQQKPPQMCQIVHVRPRISCRCEQTLTWMSGCQSAARRKSLPLCSCVQLSPRKKMTFTRLPADAESTQGDRPERRPEY